MNKIPPTIRCLVERWSIIGEGFLKYMELLTIVSDVMGALLAASDGKASETGTAEACSEIGTAGANGADANGVFVVNTCGSSVNFIPQSGQNLAPKGADVDPQAKHFLLNTIFKISSPANNARIHHDDGEGKIIKSCFVRPSVHCIL